MPLYLIPSALLLFPFTACSSLHHAVCLWLAHPLAPAGSAAPHPPAGAGRGAVPCCHGAAANQGLQVGGQGRGRGGRGRGVSSLQCFPLTPQNYTHTNVLISHACRCPTHTTPRAPVIRHTLIEPYATLRPPNKNYTDIRIEADEMDLRGGVGLEPALSMVRAPGQAEIPDAIAW